MLHQSVLKLEKIVEKKNNSLRVLYMVKFSLRLGRQDTQALNKHIYFIFQFHLFFAPTSLLLVLLYTTFGNFLFHRNNVPKIVL